MTSGRTSVEDKDVGVELNNIFPSQFPFLNGKKKLKEGFGNHRRQNFGGPIEVARKGEIKKRIKESWLCLGRSYTLDFGKHLSLGVFVLPVSRAHSTEEFVDQRQEHVAA